MTQRSSSDAGSQRGQRGFVRLREACVKTERSTMTAYRKLLAQAVRVLVPGIMLLLCSGALRAQLYVDCSGTNPNAYSTINAALQNANNPGGLIFVTGTCNENVFLFGQN